MRNWSLKAAVFAIVLLSAAADIIGFLRVASHFGLPWWAAVVFVTPLKVIEWQFLTFARLLWVSGWLGKLISPVAALIWSTAVGLSSVATHSTVSDLLEAADRVGAKKAERRTHVLDALAGVNGQIGSTTKSGVPRPVGTVEQALAWIALPARVRAATADCRRIDDDLFRRPCREMLDLRKELATSRDYEQLVLKANALRTTLAELDIEASQDPMPRSFELLFGQALPMQGKDGIAFMGMLVLALVSAFGPFGLHILSARDGRHERAAQSQVSMDPGLPTQNLPAHDPAQACPTNSAQSGGGQPARALAQTCPPMNVDAPSKPAQTSTGIAVGQASSPAHTFYGEPARLGAQESAYRQAQCARNARPARRKGEVVGTTARKAVEAFVLSLEVGPGLRATGSGLAQAFAERRIAHGWPELPANVFGMHVKAVVVQLGGRKIKSGCQVYEGVRVPPHHRVQPTECR